MRRYHRCVGRVTSNHMTGTYPVQEDTAMAETAHADMTPPSPDVSDTVVQNEPRVRDGRLHDVLAQAPIVLFAVDRDGVFTLSEGEGLRLMGLQAGQHVGQSYFSLYGNLPDSGAAMRRALAGEDATTLNAFGDLLFETRWRPTRDPDGTVSGVIGVSADVTARTRLERRAQESLTALLAMAQTLVQTPSGEGSKAVGIEVVGQRLADLTREVLDCQRVAITAIDDRTGVQRPVAVAGLTPEQARQWWVEQQNASLDAGPDPALTARFLAGEALVVDMRQPPFRDLPNPYGVQTVLVAPMRVGERLAGSLSLDYGAIAHDFTPDEVALAQGVARLGALVLDRDRLAREQAEAHAAELALRETTRRMDEFLGVASHELRSPLTGIKGNGQLAQHRLERIAADERVAATDLVEKLDAVVGLLRRSDGQIGRVLRLVNDLLDVSRIEANHLEPRPAPCDLRTIVAEAVEDQRRVWLTRVIDLALPHEPVPIQADEDRMAQVVTNYLANALKYSAEDRPVAVSLTIDGAAATVRVRDEGPGLTQEQQEQVWERYRRVTSVAVLDDTHAAGGGLGLGLYISRTIITGHGGQVGVESTPGVGSTFWFTVPLAPAPA